jgi:hypothetical protein
MTRVKIRSRVGQNMFRHQPQTYDHMKVDFYIVSNTEIFKSFPDTRHNSFICCVFRSKSKFAVAIIPKGLTPALPLLQEAMDLPTAQKVMP